MATASVASSTAALTWASSAPPGDSTEAGITFSSVTTATETTAATTRVTPWAGAPAPWDGTRKTGGGTEAATETSWRGQDYPQV